MHLPERRADSFSEDRPLGWDPVAEGNRAGDGMARFVSEEKAIGLLPCSSCSKATNALYYYHKTAPVFR